MWQITCVLDVTERVFWGDYTLSKKFDVHVMQEAEHINILEIYIFIFVLIFMRR